MGTRVGVCVRVGGCGVDVNGAVGVRVDVGVWLGRGVNVVVGGGGVAVGGRGVRVGVWVNGKVFVTLGVGVNEEPSVALAVGVSAHIGAAAFPARNCAMERASRRSTWPSLLMSPQSGVD